ncbi:MAG TPA: glycosyltransferase family 2 protein [Gemmatirosa sp.]
MASAAAGRDTTRSAPPLVTVLITAHDRTDELRATLRALRDQTYPALEVLVVDDASSESLEPVVRAEWPSAQFTRNTRNRGLIASRSEAMARARGEYIVTLDDDSHPVAPDAIRRAVDRMSREPELGVLAFRVHDGIEPPDPALPAGAERYTYAFIGCGNMIRTAVARALGGYRDDFEYYYEETEYGLRVIGLDARILYFPEVVVHHRLSSVGRSEARIVAYSFRNALWTAFLRLPLRQAIVEVPWKAAVGGVELLRKGDPRWLAWAVGGTLRGLPRILRDRAPISDDAARTYDALRFRTIATAPALLAAEPPTWRERYAWFRAVWMRRRRGRAFWDRRPGGIGVGVWTTRERER